MAAPPPDHLVPYSWLEKLGVTELEIYTWIERRLAIKVTIHGGLMFIAFSANLQPIRFKDVADWVAKTRQSMT